MTLSREPKVRGGDKPAAPDFRVFPNKRRIETQCALPNAETAAMLFWALIASGQIPCAGSVAGKRWTRRRSSSRLTSPHECMTVGFGSYAKIEFPQTIGHDPRICVGADNDRPKPSR